MRKVFLSVAVLGAIAVITILSCRKSYNAQGPVKSLNQLFSSLRTAPQTLSVTAGRDTIVYGANGTVLHFYSNTFMDANNNIITSGTINLQLVEMYKPGDFIANRATTTATSGQALQSGGQINILATMNGQEVHANVYGIAFPQSSASSQKMELWYGNTNNADSSVLWTVCDTNKNGSVSVTTVGDTDGFFFSYTYYIPPPAPKPWYYAFDSCTSFGFCNCDYFWQCNAATLTDVHVIMSDTTFNNTNTQVFIAFPADKVNIGLTGKYDFSLDMGYTPGVPIGLNYELVVIANKNGSYYYFEQSGVVTNGMTITPALAPDTRADVLARMAGL